MENKKIKNASNDICDGIEFKSRLEKGCYKLLKTSGLDFSYEPETIVLLEGFKPSLPIYAPKRHAGGKYDRQITLQKDKIRDITYTPDFVVTLQDFKIYFDVKGYPNDTYLIKRKMFMEWLHTRNDGIRYMFFEPHSIRQMQSSISIIEQLIETKEQTE